MTRALRTAALGVAGSLLLVATPAVAGTPRATSHVSAKVIASSATTHGAVTVSGTVQPRVSGLVVSVQRLEGRAWHTVGHATESPAGTWSVRVATPSSPGTLSLRAVRPGTSAVKAAVSRTLRVQVAVAVFHVTAHLRSEQVANGSPIVVSGKVAPATTGSVILQRLVGSAWTTLTSEHLIGSAYTFSTRQNPGSYVLRVAKPASTFVAKGVSPTVSATVAFATSLPLPPAVVITTEALPSGTTRQAYSATLSASGGTVPYTWRLVSGTLPAGLTLSPAGVLSGTPTAAAWAPLAVEVTDAAGTSATVALTLTITLAQGPVMTWGTNANGELGDGLPVGSDIAAVVPGLSGVTQVALHGKTAYALTNGGAVSAWGAGYLGQLGNGDDVASPTPVPVTGLASGVTAIAAGSNTGFALKADGTVRAWGNGGDGELGDGDHLSSRVPAQIPGLSGVSAIAAEDTAGLALKSDGTVWRWGQDYAVVGHGGEGEDNHHYTPDEVPGLTGQAVIAIGGGGQSGYAVMADHTVRTWGPEVGESAVPVSGLTHITAVLGGASTSYALDSTGVLFAWGSGGRGQLGNGGTDSSATPVAVPGLPGGVAAFGAGGDSAYAVMNDHTVWAWGANDAGQLGDGNTLDSLNPVQTSGLTDAAAVAGGAVVLHADGTVSSWGPSLVAYETRSAPGQVAGIADATSFVEDDLGGAVVRADGSVWDWGDNLSGELGNGSLAANSDTPVQVSGLSQVVAVAGRGGTRYALRSDGTVWAWGANRAGAFGTDTPAQSSLPVLVPGIDGVTAITAGTDTAFALRSDGTVWSWGYNGLGSLGDGDVQDRATPAPIAGLTHIVSVVAARWTVYAVTDDGHVWGWGDGFEQQLDPTAQTQADSPILLDNISGVTSMATSGGTAYAVRTDGTVVWWGFDPFYVIDETLPIYVDTPQPVPGVAGATAVAATDYGGAALMAGGTVVTWGSDRNGQPGWDVFTGTKVAVPVQGLTGVTQIWAGGEETGALRTG